MIKTGENKCFVCGSSIPWYFNLNSGNRVEAFTIPNGRVVAEAVATGRGTTSEGNKTQFEVTVSCPYCNNRNKFEY